MQVKQNFLMNHSTEKQGSGNIFGWKISFISLGIILITLLAVLILDEPPMKSNFKTNNPHLEPDTITINKDAKLKH